MTRAMTEYGGMGGSREALLSAVINAWPAPVLVFDRDLTIVELNQAATTILGRSRDELAGKNIDVMVAGLGAELVERRRKLIRTVFETGETMVYQQQLGDLTLEGRATAIRHDGEITHVTIYLTDMTASERDKAHLREAQQAASLGSFEIDIASDHITWSDHLLRMFELDSFPTATAGFEHFLTRMLPDDRADYVAARAAWMESGTELEREVRMLQSDGDIRNIVVRLLLERHDDGRPKRVFGTLRDITESERLKNHLHEAQAVAGVGSFEGDAKSTETTWSVQMCRILGIDTDRPLAMNLGELIRRVHPDDRERLRSQRADAAEESHMLCEHLRVIRDDGEMRHVELRARYTPQAGKGMHVFGTLHDVTEQRSLEDAWRMVFADSSDAILGLDSDSRITLFNPGAERMFGHAPADVVSQHVTCLMDDHHAERHPPNIELAYTTQTEGTWTREVVGRRANGTDFPFEIALSRTPQGYLAIIRDISARRAAEAEREQREQRVRQREKLEALGTLASGIAHDFNNLLTPVMTYSFLLQEEQDAKRREEMLEAIRTATERGADLVRQILAFGRDTGGQAAPVDVGALVTETANMLRASLPARVEIRANVKGDHWTTGDAAQLQTALLNLGVNASQAMPDGGVLDMTVSSRSLEDDEAKSEGVERGRYVTIAVSDTGDGIAEDVVDRIFEPFFTTKLAGEGTGMGLPSAHGIVKSHGGTLVVHTRPAQGTTFTMLVPERDPVAERVDATTQPSSADGKRVLVVDDDEQVLQAAVRLLRRAGFTATPFLTTDSAIDAVKLQPSQYDAALVDYSMPLDGFATSRLLREVEPTLPIVLTTGMPTNELAALVKDMNLIGPLAKPFRPRELVAAIEAAIAAAPR